MAQRGVLPPLRVSVPTLGNSPSQRLSKYQLAFSPSPTPTPVIYQRPHNGRLWIAVLLQLSSLYAAHQWLLQSSEQGQRPSLIRFAFLAFFATSVVLGFSQKPWKGRTISKSQWAMLFISGALLALSFLLRMRGLADVGPLETILAEYAGAVVGKVLIKAQRKVHGIGDAKIRGAVAFLIGLFLLSQGWAISSCSPLSTLFLPATKARKVSSPRLTRATRIGYAAEARDLRSQTAEDCAKYAYILGPVFAGLLSSMQKLLPSSTSLVNVPKKRLQALTYVTAGAVFIPVALLQLVFQSDGTTGGLDQTVLWPLFSMIAFGLVLGYYGEFFSEEKLLISPLSPFHYFVTVCSVCLLELTYGSNFSLLGFVVCSAILAVGVRSGAFISGGLDWNSMSEKEYTGSSLFTMMKTPLYHIWTDVKTRKIAMFLLLNTSFMVVEFVYGFLSNSLGLISDACHMLFDCAALAIGLYASYISRLPPNSKFNFGYGRFEVLSGYANAVFLILVASLIVLESLERLLEPPEISTESLLVVSVGGLLVNVVGLLFFHEAHHHAHGSAPCTHSHGADPKKVVLSSTSKLGDEHAPMSIPHVHHSSSAPQAVHSHGPTPTMFHKFGQDSPILNLQHSPPKVNGYDSHQHSASSSAHGAGSNYDGHVSHSPKGPSLDEHEHSHGPFRLQTPTGQFSHQQPFSPRGGPLFALQHGRGAGGSSHTHHDKHGQSAFQGHPVLEPSHSHSNHQHHDHSGGCSQDHNHHDSDHVDDSSPGHWSPLHSPLHVEHQHSGSPSHQKEDRRDQQNPFVQQARSDGVHQHSGACSHNHTHQLGQSGSQEQHSSQHPPSHSDCHHFGDHHDHIHNTNKTSSNSGTRHQYNAISSVPGKHGHGHTDNHHHQHSEEGVREVLDSSDTDHGAGHPHHHGGQLCTHDHGHHHEEHEGHDHGHSHSHEGEHHHHHDHDGHDHDHEGHHHDHDEHHDHHHDHDGHDHDHEGHHHDHDEHHDHHHIDHNMEGIFLHILADTLGSVGVVISTLLIKYKGWLFTDPACSIFISLLIVSSVLPLVRNSAELLLQRVPRSAEKRIQKALKKVEEVEGVHDWHQLHVWSYTNTELVGTLRLHASIGTDKQFVHKKASRILEEAGIIDLTLEVEDLEHADDQ